MVLPGTYSAALLSALLWFFLPAGISSCSNEAPLQGEVVRVTDGDTAVIALKGRTRTMTCRLYGIDAPERRRRDRKGQPYAQESGRELRRLISGSRVEIITTGEKTYGREVCIIKKDGTDINLEMVRSGHAWAYRKHLRAPYASLYIDAEDKARRERAGIWQQDAPLPPWEFKRRYWN